MTEKGRQIFLKKNRVTPSVAAPGDTNPSDATGYVVWYALIHTNPNALASWCAFVDVLRHTVDLHL